MRSFLNKNITLWVLLIASILVTGLIIFLVFTVNTRNVSPEKTYALNGYPFSGAVTAVPSQYTPTFTPTMTITTTPIFPVTINHNLTQTISPTVQQTYIPNNNNIPTTYSSITSPSYSSNDNTGNMITTTVISQGDKILPQTSSTANQNIQILLGSIGFACIVFSVRTIVSIRIKNRMWS